MSNIIVRKGNAGALSPSFSGSGEWEPMRWMRDIMRWDQFREMAPMWPTEDRGATFAPSFEVKETKDAYVFKADIPGVREQDLEITLAGNRLTVSGKREADHQDKGDTYFAYERLYGSFVRAFTLPDGVDAEHVRAELKEGVLMLLVGKKAEVQPKRITIKADKAKD